MGTKTGIWLYVLLFGLYCGAAIAAFAPALNADFVFDDTRLVVENPDITSLLNVPEMFARAFSGSVYIIRPGGSVGVDPGYRPMRFVSYAIDHRIAGGLNPFVFHLSNLLHHALAAFILLLLLRHLGFSLLPSFLGGLLFLLHPLNSEPACYVTGRKDILCAIFYMAAFISYIRWRRGGRLGWAVVLFLFFLASFFCKEMALTLPFAILIWELLRRRRIGSIFPSLKLLIPLTALSFLLLALQMAFKNPSRSESGTVGWWGGTILTNMLTIPRLILFYIRLVFLPWPLSANYSYNAFPASEGLFSPPWTFFAVLLLIAIVVFGFYAWRKRWSITAFSIFFFLGTLVPVSQIYPLPDRVAERFLYIPIIAFCVGVVFLLQRLRRRRGVVFATVVVCLVYGTLDIVRSRDWKNEYTLFSAVLGVYPNCALAHVAVGAELLRRNEAEKALTHFHRAEEILKSAPPDPWNRGLLLQARYYSAEALIAVNRKTKASSILKRLLLETDSLGHPIISQWQYLHIHFNLANILYERGLPETAWEMYQMVVTLARGHTDDSKVRAHCVFALHKMAMIAVGKGAYDESVRLLRQALKTAISTDHEPIIRLYLAQSLIKTGRYEEAIKETQKARSLTESWLSSKRPRDLLKPLTDKPVDAASIKRVKEQSLIVEACALRSLGALEAAVDTLRGVLKERFSEWAVCELARCFLIMEKPEEAFRVLESSLRRISKPRRPDFLTLLTEARRQIRLRNPQYIAKRIKSAVNAAKSLYSLGREEDARDILKKSLKLAANLNQASPSVYLYLAEAHLLLLNIQKKSPSRNDLVELERLLGLAEKGDADVSPYWAAVGEMWVRRGDVDAAVKAFHRSGLPKARFQAAMLLLSVSREEEALRELKECAKTDYRRPDVFYHLGMLLARLRRYEEAADAMRNFLKISDRNDPRRGLIKTLLQTDKRLKGGER